MRRALLTASLAACLLIPAAAHAAGPPIIKSTSFSHVTTDSATLEATIDPNGKATKYHFEYGPADCSSGPCTSVPTNDPKREPQISGLSPATPVTFQLEGLDPGTTYHLRIVARNVESEKSIPPVVEGPDTVLRTYPIHALGSCPANDDFRSGKYAPADHPSAALPDCRAYEQASPVDKSGEDARGINLAIRASADGNRATFITTNGIPGGDGGQQLPTYLATRSTGAWSSQGLLPAQSAGNLAGVLGWSPDLSQVFAWAGTARETAGKERVDTNFFSRSSADGSLTTIGPVTTDVPEFAASTPDGSLVLFESRVALPGIPGALEGNDSFNLYLWDRTTGRVSLGGVLNDGHPPAQGTFAGSYDWNSGTSAKALSEGGANQHYYTQDNHVLAASGAYLYFTAKGTGRLYVRVNPTQPQSAMTTNPTTHEEECTKSAKACTIRVSSEKTNGSGEEGRDAAGEAPAAFAAATADGKNAFLLSSEKLTDDATTGPEPGKPAIARASIDGNGKELTYLPARAKELAVDSEYVYWSDPEAGTIGRAKIGSPKPTEVKANFIGPLTVEVETEPGHTETIPARPNYLAIQGEYLYWTNDADGKDEHGTIGRAKLTPTGPEDIKPEFITGASNPQGIAVDDEYIYWANNGSQSASGLFRSDSEGTHAGRFEVYDSYGDRQQGLPKLLGQDRRNSSASIAGLAIDGGALYVVEESAPGDEFGSLLRFSLSTGIVQEPGMGTTQESHERPGFIGGVAVDQGHYYLTNSKSGNIGRSDLSGFSTIRDAAVDSHGDLFIDSGNAVKVFGPSGSSILDTEVPEEALYTSVSGCGCKIGGVAVLGLAVDSDGDILVSGAVTEETKGAQTLVVKLRPSNPGSPPTASTTYSLDKRLGQSAPGSEDGDGILFKADHLTSGVNNYLPLAVDPSNDDIYVGQGDHISEYSPVGALLTAAIGTGVSNESYTPRYIGLGVYGKNHAVYAADRTDEGGDPGRAYIFSAANLAGPPQVTIDGTNTPAGSLDLGVGVGNRVAVDQANGNLYLANTGEENDNRILDKFSPGGAFLSNIDSQGLGSVAVDGSNGSNQGSIYLVGSVIATQEPNGGFIDAFTSAGVAIPSLSHQGYNQSFGFLTNAGHPLGLAVDPSETHLYWVANQGGANPGTDLYRFEPEKPAGHRLNDLSVDPVDVNGAEVRGLLGTSEDGSHVYFAANGVLTGSPNEAGELATPGDCHGAVATEGACQTNLYLSRPDSTHPGQGEIIFIARLMGADKDNWRSKSSEASRASRVSPDGSTLLFTSSTNLTPYDTHGAPELYRYREGQGILCVSCNPTGAPPQGRPSFGDSIGLSFLTPSSPAPTLTRNLSASGNRVFFESTDPLLPEDTNDPGGCPQTGPFNGAYPSCLSVYEWEADGSGSCESQAENGGCLYLLSPHGEIGASFFGDASASGDDVFLFTRAPLVGQDADRLLDLYDARVGGGLLAQNQPSIAPCESAEACHGPTGNSTVEPLPATPNFHGPTNPIEKPCPKGKVRRNGKCVAKRHTHRKPHKRQKHSTQKHSTRRTHR